MRADRSASPIRRRRHRIRISFARPCWPGCQPCRHRTGTLRCVERTDRRPGRDWLRSLARAEGRNAPGFAPDRRHAALWHACNSNRRDRCRTADPHRLYARRRRSDAGLCDRKLRRRNGPRARSGAARLPRRDARRFAPARQGDHDGRGHRRLGRRRAGKQSRARLRLALRIACRLCLAEATIGPDQRIKVSRLVAAVDAGQDRQSRLWSGSRSKVGCLRRWPRRPFRRPNISPACREPCRCAAAAFERLRDVPKVEIELIQSDEEPGGISGLGMAYWRRLLPTPSPPEPAGACAISRSTR